jgi:hypothetical protein
VADSLLNFIAVGEFCAVTRTVPDHEEEVRQHAPHLGHDGSPVATRTAERQVKNPQLGGPMTTASWGLPSWLPRNLFRITMLAGFWLLADTLSESSPVEYSRVKNHQDATKTGLSASFESSQTALDRYAGKRQVCIYSTWRVRLDLN